MKSKAGLCRFPLCGHRAKRGTIHCAEHAHTAALQRKIEEQKAALELTWLPPEAARLLAYLKILVFNADPKRAAQIQVTARSRGHGLTDGISLIGEDMLTPGYAVSSYRDRGRLGAAEKKIRDLADDLGFMAGVHQLSGLKKKDQRCGRDTCPGQWLRQRHDALFCSDCGRPFKAAAKSTPPTDESDE